MKKKEQIKSQLEERNKKIIDAVVEKMLRDCPGAVSIIGVAGSFYTGDFYEKSDLDLLIISDSQKVKPLLKCFILDDVGFDIYCTPWSQIERMTEYLDPYVTKLLDLDIVYVDNDSSIQRYMSLRSTLKDKLQKLYSAEDCQKAEYWFNKACESYADVMIYDNYAQCKFACANFLYAIEFMIYLINKSYIKFGVKRIPEELSKMRLLPEHFLKDYAAVVSACSVGEIKYTTTVVLKNAKLFLQKIKSSFCFKKAITAEDLTGTYEEIYSNWRNKMYHAVEIKNTYLSFMTMASCQAFYHEMYEQFDIPPLKLMKYFDPNDLKASAKAFDKVMGDYLKLYDRFEKPIVQYQTIEEFLQDYLLKKEE